MWPRAGRLAVRARRRGLATDAAAARAATLGQFDSSVMRTYGRYDIVLSHGEGREVWDVDGKRYLDMGGGIAVNSLGHAHPEVLEAIGEQAAKLTHCSNLYYTEPQGALGDALTRLFANGQGKVFFCNSGAEANEGLFKLARAWGQRDQGDTDPATARYEIVTAVNSFHGRTVACIAATGQDKIKAGFGPMVPGYSHVPFNDLQAVREAIGPQVCPSSILGLLCPACLTLARWTPDVRGPDRRHPGRGRHHACDCGVPGGPAAALRRARAPAPLRLSPVRPLPLRSLPVLPEDPGRCRQP